MNFIDKALSNAVPLSDDEFLQAMADIYKEPEVRTILGEYPQYIQDVIRIIDYDTELQMEGLEGVTEGSLSDECQEIYRALVNCRAAEEARILKAAKELQRDRDDYDAQMEKLEAQTSLYRDYDSFWDLVRTYIGNNRDRKEN